MFEGKIYQFDPSKGYGYIADEKGEQYFVFISSFRNIDDHYVQVNDRVKFELAHGRNGVQAINVYVED